MFQKRSFTIKGNSTDMILRGVVVDMTKVDGIIAYDEKEIVGMITYRFFDDVCEILSLDSFKENQGLVQA